MSKEDINPEVKKLVVKILVYALTAIASFIGGNVSAKQLNYHMFNPQNQTENVKN